MILPVRSVDLPRIVLALDQRFRTRASAFATFVVAPQADEPQSGLAALLGTLLPISPNAYTWICEDRWRLLGLAQARQRPGASAWDLTYLAALTAPGGQPAPQPQHEVLFELLRYALEVAARRGVQRFFARVEDDRPEMQLFARLGFQCYARELTYWLESPAEALPPEERPAQPGASPLLSRLWARHAAPPPRTLIRPAVPLRRWQRHDAWGLLRLYDACTPRRVQMAEGLTSEELVHTRAGGGRTWYVPLLEPNVLAFVNDRGVRLGGWLRLRYGRGAQPHQLSLLAHPDDEDVSPALLHVGLRLLAEEAPRPVVCQVREYESASIAAVRAAGFEHIATHALLVRHQMAHALARRESAVAEARVVYGVRGLGTAPSRLSEGETTPYARHHH